MGTVAPVKPDPSRGLPTTPRLRASVSTPLPSKRRLRIEAGGQI